MHKSSMKDGEGGSQSYPEPVKKRPFSLLENGRFFEKLKLAQNDLRWFLFGLHAIVYSSASKSVC